MMKTNFRFRPNGGYSLGFAVPMAMLLLFSSLAFLKWQVYEKQTSIHQVAVTQAYYTAQAAVIEVPLSYMRGTTSTALTGLTHYAFPNGAIPGFGTYESPAIDALVVMGEGGSALGTGRDYILSAVGVVTYNESYNTRNDIKVKRKAQLHVRRAQFSNYFYLTNTEQTRFNEMIWFWAPDTLAGRVHSNTVIGINGGLFRQLVTSSAANFVGNVNAATFQKGWRLRVPPVDFPFTAEVIRNGASGGGQWFDTQNKIYSYGLQFNGRSAIVWRWRTGTGESQWYGDITRAVSQINWGSNDYAIFCDGDLWIKGVVDGRVGVGAAGNLRIMDNFYYTGLSEPGFWDPTGLWTRQHPDSPMATLISEAREPIEREDPWTGILIANTPANGREQGRDRFGTHARAHVVICGQLIALQSSFTFEDHNDTWDPYQSPINGNDERGTIFLRGAVAQNRRGYVHRSNHNGTGYAKGYIYDERFTTSLKPPPFTIEVTSTGGFAKWGVQSWVDLPRERGDGIR